MHRSETAGNILANAAGLLVLGLFGLLMAGFFVPAYNGVDENGYLCAARRMALTGDSAKYTVHPLESVSENVVQVRPGVFYPKYPLGYPWLAALAYWFGGPAATFWVNPILALLAVAGMFWLARAMVGPLAGVLAAILLATNPWHAVLGLSGLSHAGATCGAVWSMYFLWRWLETGGRWKAGVAGALAAFAYTVRYTEALLLLPVAAMVIWRYAKLPEGATPTEHNQQIRHWRWDVLWLAAGMLAVATPLWIHHWRAFGAPWRTGYGLCGESTGFAWKWFQENWWLMLTKLNTPGLLFVFPVGLAGLAYVAVHDPKRAVLLGLWIVPPVVLYTAYYWAPQGDGWGYLRFFVSVFPGLIVCALALLCEAVKPRPLWSVALGVFVAVVATFNLRETITTVDRQTDQLAPIARAWDRVRARIPDGSILIAQYYTLLHLEFVGIYELYSHETFDSANLKRRLTVLNDQDPHPFQRDKAQALARAIGQMNDAQLVTLQRSLLASNVAAGRIVALVCPTDAFRPARGRLGDAFSYVKLDEWAATSFTISNEPRATIWGLYQLGPRDAHSPVPESLADVEEKIDQTQFSVRMLRDAFDQQYPGAKQKLDEINGVERQLRDLRDKAKQLAARKPASVTGNPTNAPARK